MYKSVLSILVGDALLLSLYLLEHSMYTRPCMLILTVTKAFRAVKLYLQQSKTSCQFEGQIPFPMVLHAAFSNAKCAFVQPQSMRPEEVGIARTCAITQILGTDMKKHFDILSRFQVLAAHTCAWLYWHIALGSPA